MAATFDRHVLDTELAKHLYDSGYSDEKIAEKAGVVRGTVAHWRNKLGLPPIDGKTGLRKVDHKLSKLEQDVHDATIMGLSYGAFKSKFPHGLMKE